MKPWHAVVSVLAFAVAALAQNQPLQPVKITRVVGEYTATYSPSIKTDREGNVYVQLMEGVGRSSSSRGIVKISRDGTRVTRFDTQGVRDVERLMDFTPSPWGDVYVLWQSRGSHTNVVARYSPEGQLLSSNKVDVRVFAGNIAALAGGNLVLAILKGPSRDQVEPVADIVSDTGAWIASVSLQTAVSETTPDAVQRAQHGSSPWTRGVELLTSDDGEAYLTWNNPHPAVFRILPSGQVTRYDLPRPDGQIRINGTFAAGGQMLVSYELLEQTDGPNNFIVKGRVCELIDIDSGRTRKVFPAKIGLHLIAFGPNSLLYFRPVRTSSNKSRFEFRETPME